jgi:3-carboxy-cis,cis-muconate cycloisomerase
VAVLSAGCLLVAERVVREAVVYPERMAANLALEQGRTLAEAYMFQLAPELGREGAHDLVYLAATTSKARGIELREALEEVASGLEGTAEIDPADYTGQAPLEARRAVEDWRRGSST